MKKAIILSFFLYSVIGIAQSNEYEHVTFKDSVTVEKGINMPYITEKSISGDSVRIPVLDENNRIHGWVNKDSIGGTTLPDGLYGQIFIQDGDMFIIDGAPYIIDSNQIEPGAIQFSDLDEGIIESLMLANGSVQLSELESQLGSANYFPQTSGSFVPVLTASSSDTFTYTLSHATYTRHGNRVTFNIRFSGIDGTSTGQLRITGFPFTVDYYTMLSDIQIWCENNFYSINAQITNTTINFYAQTNLDGHNGESFNNVGFSSPVGMLHISGTITITE